MHRPSDVTDKYVCTYCVIVGYCDETTEDGTNGESRPVD